MTRTPVAAVRLSSDWVGIILCFALRDCIEEVQELCLLFNEEVTVCLTGYRETRFRCCLFYHPNAFHYWSYNSRERPSEVTMQTAWVSARTGLLFILIVQLVTTDPCNEDFHSPKNLTVKTGNEGFPSPRNLTVRSRNFTTVFSWKYDTLSPKPLFSVRMRYYRTGSSKYAQHCINITSMECDVSSLINNVEDYYILFVSAAVGTNRSCDSFIKMSLPEQGVLDFPPVNMTADGRKVTAEFQRPDIMYKKKHSFLRKQNEFVYMIKYWEKAAENLVSTPSTLLHFTCPRNQQRCKAKVLVPKEDAEYCFSFEGKIFEMPINTSKDVCLTDPAKEDKSLAIILSGIILILIAVTVLTSLLVYKLLKSRTTILPSSLLFFLKGIKPFNYIQKEETTCSSVRTAESPTSNQTLLHEEVGVDEMFDKGVASMENSRMKIGCSNVETETEQISFLEIVKPENNPNVVFVDTGDEFTNPDEDIRTVSTMLESGSSTDSIQSNPIVSFGYDRPQVLVEMNFDDIVEGYKHTQLE
ncbi:interferon gamma receptor 1-like [Erpetoichthys calabaricus]|uniref:Fibronectin type-III domain-containing protein n=1 Tax=Erpetoichthys calabaricus TaxID=27687 RepID=A0A8C4SML9_ERPCA|nr:interferon gamma receptor 1-like [Erpetoichthys calabaricus]